VAATAVALARDLADRGARTLARHLADHDSGSWSYYGLMTPGRAWRTHLADLNYHCYHVRLLERLAKAHPGLPFAATAARWQGYVDRAGATCPPREPWPAATRRRVPARPRCAAPRAGRWAATRRRRAGSARRRR